MLTEELMTAAICRFLSPLPHERLRLPEPDGKFDAEKNKKIPLSPEEKKVIVDEQVKLVEAVELAMADEVKKIKQESPPEPIKK